ncbi:MAG TPA: lysyl oxidase family protein [Enhygromyxa sp.]|nr:lysyl oxidase family protein [Enhygromyxa sp.]
MLRRGSILGVCVVLGCQGYPVADDGESTTDGSGESDTSVDENLPPAAPTLVSPSDAAVDVPLSAELCWNPAEDPEGDALGYRVWVDEVELANGKTGEYGFSGTCTGPLNFVGDRTFSWRVRAFELDDPARESPDSETWAFTTIAESDSTVLLFDDFSRDQGWTISGDASTGAWVRGTPQQVFDVAFTLAQPGSCFVGDGCFYTGDNPSGQLGTDDVDGGSVVLLSPPFDPGEAQSVSVSLARFFHRSDLVPTGVSLELALLVPDPDAPDGVIVHVLEKLDGGPQAEVANLWESVAFAACGIELSAGTRLRITASDLVTPEEVIVEAAIDEVRIEGYTDTDICSPGVGALCDPDDPEPACGPDLLCCAEGPVFDGVYRCEQPVPALGEQPPAAPGDPLSGPLGCNAADLAVLDWDLNVYMQNLWVEPEACTLYEGCVGGTGWRRVLRFDTKTANIGSRDLILGVPANHPDLFTFSPCHEHHHFDNYARYTLLAGEEQVAAGHKQAFCLVDWEPYSWPDAGESPFYTCFNQGLSLGWSDTYGAHLDCQWIDVTDLAPGEYTLRMEVNLPPEGVAHSTLVERSYDNNVLEIPVVVD